PANNTSAFSVTITPPVQCPTSAPELVSPAAGDSITSPVSFSWTSVPDALAYKLTINGAGAPQSLTTSDTSAKISLANGNYTWFVEVVGEEGCNAIGSAIGRFAVCTAPD